MVGRCRVVSQRRVRDVRFDSKSPNPHTVSLTRGLPSPTAPHFRRAPPSPSLRTHHRRSRSPMLSSLPDPEECSSAEGGVSLGAAGASPEGEVLSDVAGGLRFTPLLVQLRSIPEVKVMLEGSMSATSSGSSTLSPATAVLLCQDSIAAVFHEEERLQLVRSESSYSISSSSMDDPASMPPGVRERVAASGGEQGGGASIGGVDVPGFTECLPNLSSPENFEHHGSEDAAVDAVDCGGQTLLVNASSPFPGVSVVQNVGSGSLGESRAVAASPNGGPLLPLFATVDIDIGGMENVGGLVREEDRVSPVVREALRSQPSDGLRQSPSSSVLPVSGAESGDANPPEAPPTLVKPTLPLLVCPGRSSIGDKGCCRSPSVGCGLTASLANVELCTSSLTIPPPTLAAASTEPRPSEGWSMSQRSIRSTPPSCQTPPKSDSTEAKETNPAYHPPNSRGPQPPTPSRPPSRDPPSSDELKSFGFVQVTSIGDGLQWRRLAQIPRDGGARRNRGARGVGDPRTSTGNWTGDLVSHPTSLSLL
ncbi:hypothetical protein Dimus_013503 [Dionaea muscipula]